MRKVGRRSKQPSTLPRDLCPGSKCSSKIQVSSNPAPPGERHAQHRETPPRAPARRIRLRAGRPEQLASETRASEPGRECGPNLRRLVDGAIIGYYSLVVGHVEFADAPERLRKGLARHPVPIMLLARLAVHINWQRKGVGRALLRDAVLRTLQAADIAGIRALAVHAKDDQARQYYQQFNFAPSPTDPLHLFVLLKDIRKLVPTALESPSPK